MGNAVWPAEGAGTRVMENGIGAGDDAPDGTESFAVPGFDSIARIAARALRVPLVSLVLRTGSAYWYTGDGEEGPPAPALHPACRQAAAMDAPLVVPDTFADPRFGAQPLEARLAGDPLHFFASHPVFTLTGRLVGALCVMDHPPRTGLSEDERTSLRDAAILAGSGVVLRSYIGRTDPVTQLPHRSAFFEDLREHLRRSEGHVRLAAVEVAPVARFNAFLRATGHAYADELMRAVATRLQAWMPPGVRLYHVGPTRFAALLHRAEEDVEAARLDALVARLREPIDCLGIPLTIQPGIGLLDIRAHDLEGGDPLRLVMSASHAALLSARGWCIYDRERDQLHRHDFFLVTELAAALAEGTELDLAYQPRIDLESGACVAVEALARWRHPTLGDIPPGHFVALAENAGLVRGLTGWVLERSLAQLAQWRADGLGFRLSVNVSSADFEADLVARLESATRRHGLPMSALELEFTEGTLMQHSESTRRHLSELRRHGVGIAIDDFGTGYSNVAYLRQVPATSLKIDQSFVRSMHASRQDATIVRAIAELARDLGFRVVIEGVETREIYNAVLDMACDEVQGFYLSRPLPASALPGWLAAYAPTPARQPH